MEAKELRIGNFVYYENVETDEFTNDLPIEDADDLCDIYYGKEVKPIPLTEEWLLKFGFNNYNGSYILDGIHIKVNPFRFLTPDVSYDLRYVHQLQNLYFCLTGEELKLND